jgi:acyl carrier protein/flavin-dependent dehydrogenase
MTNMGKDELLNQITRMVSDTLEINQDQIDPDAHLQDLGFTSILLVTLVDKISEALDDDIHPGILLEHTTLTDFVSYLLEYKAEQVTQYLNTISLKDKNISFLHPKNQKDTAVQKIEVNTETDTWKDVEEMFLKEQGGQEKSASKDNTKTEGKDVYTYLPKDAPVIIGGGISAMLISHRLSSQNIHHIIIGPPQLGDSPKLGESMTETVTIEFTRNFKQYSQYFYPKKMTPFYMGDLVAGLRFDYFEPLVKLFTEEEIPKTFIHVDRLGFDQALYDEVSQEEECHWINNLVSDIEYCEKTDKVKNIVLKSNHTISPSYVWDCTNHVRLLGRKLDIPYIDMDPQRQVIFTHYFQENGQNLCQAEDLPWIHATNLLRADQDVDQLTGVSWLIPLGNYVSVGISMAPEDIGDRNPEEIITALTKAYQSRGLNYSKYFPRRKEIINIPSQHFRYDRFFGKNWSLVGGSATNAWFPSGSNISMVTCMAAMADKIIKQPEVYGEHYSRHVQGFAKTHEIYDTLLQSNLGALDAIKFLSGIVEQGRRRISSFYMFSKGLDSETSRVATELWNEDVLIDKKYFEYLRQIATHSQPENLKDQTDSIFENLFGLQDISTNVTLPYLRENSISQEKTELFVQ